MKAHPTIPFVIGQWVCGPRFYGRQAWVDDVLAEPLRRRWFAGLRRIGKTSFLKQIEHLTSLDTRPILPLFWDLQGVETESDLVCTLEDALFDAEERLEELGIERLKEARPRTSRDLASVLAQLTRSVTAAGASLLLLCDEADALLDLARLDPAIPTRLWQAAGAEGAVGIVLASSLRLMDFGLPVTRRGGVAGLAEGFGTPTPFGTFDDAEARALVRQERLPEADRPTFSADEVETICQRCGNHPMLLQIVAKRRLERGDLEEAWREVAHDRSIDHLFAVDFDLLNPSERRLLLELAQGGDRPPIQLEGPDAAARLLALGLLRQDGSGVPTIANPLFAAWLAHHAEDRVEM